MVIGCHMITRFCKACIRFPVAGDRDCHVNNAIPMVNASDSIDTKQTVFGKKLSFQAGWHCASRRSEKSDEAWGCVCALTEQNLCRVGNCRLPDFTIFGNIPTSSPLYSKMHAYLKDTSNKRVNT